MQEYDFQNSVTYWIRQTAQLLQRELNAELAARGITPRQAQVLSCLADEGPLSQVELAERLSIEPPSLVPVLDRMQREGLIERCMCPEDRRRRLIRPLPKADAYWAEVVEAARKVRSLVAADLSPTQLEHLNATLAHIRNGCDNRAEQRKSEQRKAAS